MKIAVLVGSLLLGSQGHSDLNIYFKNNQDVLAVESKKEYILPIPGDIFVNMERLDKLLSKLENQSYKKPLNATIDGNGKIIPGQVGYQLDKKDLIEQLYTQLYLTGPSTIEIKKVPLYPEVDSEILSQINEKIIGQYSTYFNTRNKNRSLNIFLATEAINNQVIFPGQTFSFNEVVGKRTIEKGYQLAPIIVKGELSEGVGGGICQVSSTLFNAVDNSGLKIVERYSHSKSVPYVPTGRDATVSWYGPDFQFKNNYNHPILVRARTYNGKLIITLYSSNWLEVKPRKVPFASSQLPEEVNVVNRK